MTPNSTRLEHRDSAANGVERGMSAAGARAAERASEARERRLVSERALDAILADSFPASDPPPWTLGVSHSRED
jgi:hypothetical protein